MADAITALISSFPPGTNVFDGLRAYFLSQVYHRTQLFDNGLYAIIALCGTIFLGVVVSLFLRWKSGTLTWIIKDGAMTRSDFRVVCPTLYAVFCAFEIVQSVLILRAYANQHWTTFASWFQYMNLTAIVATGYVLLGNILASTPAVRRVLMNMGSVNRSRGPLGIIVLNSIVVFAILASAASLVPSAVILAEHMPAQNDDIRDVMAVVAAAEQAQDLSLLSGLAGPVANLGMRGQKVQEAVQLAGYTTSGWLLGIWVGVGTISYISLVKAVKARIRKLELYVHDEETRQIETNMRYQQNHVELPLGKRAAQVQIQPQLSSDKPFANLAVTTEMPDKYEVILSSQLSETHQKIRSLRQVLRRDIVDHCLYLVMCLIFTSESIMHAAGMINHVEAIKILPLVHSYLASAFLSTAFPLIGLFLYDSIKLYRQGGREHSFGSEKGTAFGGRTLPNMTFDIPLHATRAMEKDTIDRPMGIIVSQSHEVTVDVEYLDGRNEKDDDKYSM